MTSRRQDRERPKRWWARLLRYTTRQRRPVAASSTLVLGLVVFDVLRPWPLKLLVDNVIHGKTLPAVARWLGSLPGAGTRFGLACWLASGTVLLVIGGAVVGALQGYLAAGVAERASFGLGRDLLDRLQAHSIRFHSQHQTGDLVKRVVTDSSAAGNLLTGVLLPSITAFISLGAMLLVMLPLDRTLSFVAIGFALPLGLVVRLLAPRMTDRSYAQYELEGEMAALAEQTLTALPVVQAFGREQAESRRYRVLADRTVRAYRRATAAQLQFSFSTGMVTGLGACVVVLVGGLHVVDGRLSIGSLLVFLSYVTSLYAPIETLAHVAGSLASAKASARRVFEIFDTVPDVSDPVPCRQHLPRSARVAVNFDHVSFAYEPDHPVLHDVTLAIEPGETLALVGATGAGKSTLVALIGRFFDPSEGRVLMDGVDISQVRVAEVRSAIAYVFQDSFLLPLTVAENIAYGCPDATREQVEAAAKAARADGFIRAMPDGYDTVIGEQGLTLSGGQRQRISVARALLRDAPIVILDEPTAALDARTEAEVVAALDTLRRGRTTIVIAHRLSTIKNADRIAVVDQGRIVEIGTHDELMQSGGFYARLQAGQVEGVFGADLSRYTELTVREVVPLLDRCPPDLLREIERIERDNKSRKTVLTALERRLQNAGRTP